MSKQYKYDAFISYRHTDLDKFVAEKIHSYLEGFKLPKNVKVSKDVNKTGIKRVFRDKEELTITNNLEDPIVQALKESEYLIVICSPRTKESVWCRTEIEKFIEFHGRNRILTVLIEGEPQDSFPEELLYEEKVVKENGSESIYRRDVEPLAADVRAKNRRKMCQLIKSELLRVIAPMFGLEYDDLRQRHRERRIKRIMTATIAAAGLGVVIGAAGVLAALEIKGQNEQIKAQNAEIEKNNQLLLTNQAKNLASASADELASDNRYGAIEMALQSLTSYDGIELPYTSQGRLALTESLRVYDTSIMKAVKQFETDSKIESAIVSSSGKYILAVDAIKKIYVWDVENVNPIYEYKSGKEVPIELDGEYIATFVGEDKVAYYNGNNQVEVYDIVNKKVVAQIDVDEVNCVKSDTEGKYIAVSQASHEYVYDANSYSVIFESEERGLDVIFSGNSIAGDWFVYAEVDAIDVDGEVRALAKINCINLADESKSFIIERESTGISDVKIDGEKLYIASDSDESKDYHTEVLCVDTEGQSVVWGTVTDAVSDGIKLDDVSGEKKVVVRSFSQLTFLDADMGTEEYVARLGSELINYTDFSEGVCFAMDSMGRLLCINADREEISDFAYMLQCDLENIDDFLVSQVGYLVTSKDEGRIVLYYYNENKDVKLYEGNEISGDDETVEDDVQEAKKIGVEDYNLVKALLYSDDKSIAFVTYASGTMDVYDVKNKKVVNSIEMGIGEATIFAGEDKDGNLYVASNNGGREGYYGYCFDKEYQLIAIIPNLLQVNKDDNTLLVGSGDDILVYPIYSTDDLIEKAKELLSF